VLLHLVPPAGPVGAWRAVDDTLHCYYPDEHAGHEPTARAILNLRGTQVPWPVWFERLAERAGYTADFALMSAPADKPLKALLGEAVALWTARNS